MLVHISITDPALSTERERIADVLRRNGDEVSFDDGSSVDDVHHADAVVCVVRPAARLVDDGTQYGERPILAALDADTPAVAYEVPGVSDWDLTDHRHGYAHARVEWLRTRLRRVTDLRPVAERSALCDAVLEDLARIGHRVSRTAPPEPIRALHRRIRAHPAPTYDALALSMHNVDHLYSVPEMPFDREVAGRYHGVEPGGAGANTMVALRRLGLRTAVGGAIGDDDNGTMLRRALEDDEISTTLLLTVDDKPTGNAVVLRTNHSYMNILDGGANEWLEEEIARRGLRDLVVSTAAESRVLHLSSFTVSAGRNVQQDVIYEVPDETLVSYKPGTLDAALGIDNLADIIGRCDVLFVADSELDPLLNHMTGFSEKMSASAKVDLLFEWRIQHAASRPLLVSVIAGQEDPARVESLRLHWGTTHREGSIGPDGAASFHGDMKDAAGARDASVAGVLFGLLRSRPPIDCANLAHVLAVSACTDYGCRRALLRPTQVRDRWRELRGYEAPRWLDPYG